MQSPNFIKHVVNAVILFGLQRSSPFLAQTRPIATSQESLPHKTHIAPMPLAPESSPGFQKIPLHHPQPGCLEWQAHKKSVEGFLQITKAPADKMQDFLSRQERDYKSRTAQSLLAHEEDWSPEYKKSFDALNTLITARNNATTELKKIQETERQYKFIEELTQGQLMMAYCQKELER
jgi:hypothetical protein